MLKESDIVVTNPPFSLFREFFDQLIKYKKKFLIIGNINAITYKSVFPLLQKNDVWIGYNYVKEFKQPNGNIKKFGNVVWFTNLDISKKYDNIILYKTYNPVDYPKYDNYNAINVDKICDIPKDYDGVIGVPVSFMCKYNPKQFSIVGKTNGKENVNGISKYKRILIKKRQKSMNIKLKEIKVRDIVKKYIDNDENGIKGYDGKLNIRPAFQREFVYKGKQRDEVIRTVNQGFPLNVMYWSVSNDGTFELLDGQQRTISLCSYINGDFSVDHKFFNNLTKTEQEKILDYTLMIYFCNGNDKEKLDWFKTINIAGEQLTNQELRNAVYAGKWLMEAKKYFSKTSCPAYHIANKYMNGRPNRQEYLEEIISWIASKENKEIEDYMAEHQHDENANDLWSYFNKVIDWVKELFPVYRKEMQTIKWGFLYNKYGKNEYNPDELEQRIVSLIDNDEVQNIKGIYEYLFDNKEKHLNLRTFDDKTKTKKYEEQKGICSICKKYCKQNEMEADHIIPWNRGGKTEINNCQLLCKKCNQEKSGK